MRLPVLLSPLLLAFLASGCGDASGAGGLADAGHLDTTTLDADCFTGQVACGGRCTDLASDPTNCGGCGVVCVLTNTMTVACTNGACSVVRCVSGFGDCDGVAANGCEADTRTDNAHCGACDRTCVLPNAAAVCAAGRCAFTACNVGHSDCDRDPANGCEVDTRTDNVHCGACGTVCAAGSVCSGGSCRVTCASPLRSCTTASSAFCANIAVDPANCGACGAACALPNVATNGCVAGHCAVASCAAGFGDCNAAAGDGCESNLQTSGANCGVCGRACTLPHASAICNAAACVIASCATGFADCDHDSPNGCEVLTGTDNAHCGGCGRTCGAGTRCSEGVCGTLCPGHQTACDGTCISLENDPTHCGTCSTVCPSPAYATATCISHVCGFACNDGFVLRAGACVAVPSPRLIAPLSTATVTSRRPRLRWALGGGADGARVEVCRDRACATVVATIDAVGESGVVSTDLPAGVLFWRVRGRAGASTGAAVSPTWEFTVGTRSALLGTSWGTTLDVNGDGYADLAVGAPIALGRTGRVHIYLGGSGGLARTPATSLTGPDGGYFGGAVASAGDLNGDGYADLAVGAYGVLGLTGRVYIYLGGSGGLAATPATTLAGPDGLSGQFGYPVASAGDINGDGYADLAVGARAASRVYVYLGGAGGPAATPTILVAPGGTGGDFGASLASAGDVNGDGFADLVVGAASASRVYLYLGRIGGLVASPTIILSEPDGPRGYFGISVASAGDVNGGGYADLAVGAYQAAERTGRVDLYFGGEVFATIPTISLIEPDATGTSFAGPVASAGDVNGDGYADLVVGAPYGDRAYAYLGGDRLGIAPPATLTIPGGNASWFGGSVTNGGDIDGDGYADLVVGASSASNVYVYRGGAGGFAVNPTVTLAGPDGVGGQFGAAVATAEDVNPYIDEDLVAGASSTSPQRGFSPSYPAYGVGSLQRTKILECKLPRHGTGPMPARIAAKRLAGSRFVTRPVGGTSSLPPVRRRPRARGTGRRSPAARSRTSS